MTKVDDIPKQKGSPANFTGKTYIQPVTSIDKGKGPATVARVTFEKGARTFWHTHSDEQVLYFLEGKGRVQLRGKKVIDTVPGDIVHIPKEKEHWHGTHFSEKKRMKHLAITKGKITWIGPVSEEDYNKR